mgnify:CR=1 FL=1
MKRVLGIFRGFPGLGRVVAGVTLLEMLRDNYDCDVKFISYLQGNSYLRTRGYINLEEATPLDYCSIGLLPTNKMGKFIHDTINQFKPDVVIVDGEPLILQSIKISHINVKVVALLNPADVDNPNNDKEAMDYFNALYSLCDLAIVHGLRRVKPDKRYKNMISVNTIIRQEILTVKNVPTNNIYCILGGGTVNVGKQFEDSTLTIGKLCQQIAALLPNHSMHIICSSRNIYEALSGYEVSGNIVLYDDIIPAEKYYRDACLVITRSGRNTLSELALLGIPSISFVSGCAYRKIEQTNNINDLKLSTVMPASLNIKPDTFADICLEMMKKCPNHYFLQGNNKAIECILKL